MKEQENKNENNEIIKEYQKMLKKIDEIEQMKMDYNSYNHLIQLKDYIKWKRKIRKCLRKL